MRGRKRTKQSMGRFLEVLKESGNVTQAARAVGVGRSTAYDWRKESVEFAARWDDAINTAVDALEAEAWRRAKDGIEKPVFHGGAQIGTIRQYSDTLLIFLLKGLRPNVFKDRAQVEHIEPPDATEALRKLDEFLKEAQADTSDA